MILTRETKFNMVLDFTAGTIGYVDYVGFLQGANEDYMDVSGFPTEDNDGNPFLMQCTRTMILYGDNVFESNALSPEMTFIISSLSFAPVSMESGRSSYELLCFCLRSDLSGGSFSFSKSVIRCMCDL